MENSPQCSTIRTLSEDAVLLHNLNKPSTFGSESSCANSLLAEAYRDVGPKTVEVTTIKGKQAGIGAGFFVGKDGDEVITNAHVVAGGLATVVETRSGEEFNARVMDVDDINDLALLKIEGISKDPNRHVELATFENLSETKLIPQPNAALGHPDGVESLIASTGKSIFKAPYYLMLSQKGKRDQRQDLAAAASADPAYSKDAAQYLMAPKIMVRTPIWHGNSGGPIVDANKKVIGVTEILDNDTPVLSYAVPSERVSDLLNRPEPKFEFKYSRQSDLTTNPLETVAESGIKGVAVYLGRKYATPIVAGALDAASAYGNITMATEQNIYAPRSHYIERGAEDVAGVAGAVMAFIPRARTLGYTLLGAKLLIDEARNHYIPKTPFLESIKRNDGDGSRRPFLWNIS